MSHTTRLDEALARHCRFIKEIARRHDYDPRLVFLILDAQDRHAPVIYNDDPTLTKALARLGEYLAILTKEDASVHERDAGQQEPRL